MARTMKRRLLLAVAILLVVAAGWWFSGTLLGGEETGTWVTAERGDLRTTVDVEGTLRAVDSGAVGPPPITATYNFKIARMAPEGDEVEPGTPILSFDTTELQQSMQRLQAEADTVRKQIEKTENETLLSLQTDGLRLAEAEAKLRKAQLKVDVPEELSKGNDLADARLDLQLAEAEVAHLQKRLEGSKRARDANLKSLNNQLSQAEGDVREIQSAIEMMTVKADRKGTVVYVTDWQDQKKKVGDQVWRGASVLELPDLTVMQAEGNVHEANAGRIETGQRVKLRLDAHPDVEFEGAVKLIRRNVQRQSWRTPLKVVKMEIELDETDPQRMRPGMRFRGEAEVEKLEDVLLIPLAAVTPTPDGPMVRRKSLMGDEYVPVELGARDDTRVQVLGGLAEGDRIALATDELEADS
ncbi:hypothetical protein ABI59_11155 [Acidobacteria bacterium Mor1]|nr:hypothetical protein ABI59_11155 [Acidobacteria bacterium Mor1]